MTVEQVVDQNLLSRRCVPEEKFKKASCEKTRFFQQIFLVKTFFNMGSLVEQLVFVLAYTCFEKLAGNSVVKHEVSQQNTIKHDSNPNFESLDLKFWFENWRFFMFICAKWEGPRGAHLRA